MKLDTVVDRRTEWFVPAWGPPAFRALIGLLFLPYTGMVLAYTIMGAMLADDIHWDRVGAIVFIYFLALGIGAHALDALGTKGVKPWGPVLPPALLWCLALSSILIAYGIGFYYIVNAAPFLAPIAVVEGFFLFAYNLEWFNGTFHTDAWFALSWGALPVLAGYVLQTNRVSLAALVVAMAMGLLSLVEIKASRPYKALKRRIGPMLLENSRVHEEDIRRFELILQSLSSAVILLSLGLLMWRVQNSTF
ncbi:MAG: hypothetical protein H0V35_08540 [Nitrospira sp.]|nr:hypothetical protein [Nitrospira sp.]